MNMANLIDRDNTLKDVIGIRITVPYSKYNTAEEVKAFEDGAELMKNEVIQKIIKQPTENR